MITEPIKGSVLGYLYPAFFSTPKPQQAVIRCAN